MLTDEQLNTLQEALYDDGQAFTALSKTLLGDLTLSLNMEDNMFLAGCTLVILLNASALSQSQKLNALYILFDIYRNEDITGNPFLAFFVEFVENEKNDAIERNFAGNLLYFSQYLKDKIANYNTLNFLSHKQLSAKSSRSYVEDGRKMNLEISYQNLNLSLFKEAIENSRGGAGSTFSNIALPLIAPLSEEDTQKLHNPQSFQIMEKAENDFSRDLSVTTRDIVLSGFRPEFIRPPPPVFHDPHSNMWVDPFVPYELMWDESLCLDNAEEMQVINLLKSARTTTLHVQQQEKIREQLEKSAKVISKAGISKDDVPGLVKNNHQIVVWILKKLYTTPGFRELMDKFNDMEITLRSMEVVNTLTSLVELPKDFLSLFVSNCMTACNNTKEKYERPRMVGFACIFFESLIVNDVIDISSIYPEMEAFCVEFSMHKGASDLFQVIKQKLAERRG